MSLEEKLPTFNTMRKSSDPICFIVCSNITSSATVHINLGLSMFLFNGSVGIIGFGGDNGIILETQQKSSQH